VTSVPVSGQEDRHQEVQEHVHGAEHHQGQAGEGHGRAEGKPEAGPPRAGPDVALKMALFHFTVTRRTVPVVIHPQEIYLKLKCN